MFRSSSSSSFTATRVRSLATLSIVDFEIVCSETRKRIDQERACVPVSGLVVSCVLIQLVRRYQAYHNKQWYFEMVDMLNKLFRASPPPVFAQLMRLCLSSLQ